MIQKKDIVLIDGALKERYYTRLKVYFGGDKSKIPTPPTRTLEMYDQGKNPHCTIFAFATALAYNTGQKYTNEFLENWSIKNIRDGGSIPSATVNRFCSQYGCKAKQIKFDEAFDFLKVGYAVIINISAPAQLFVDGINDGVINGTYPKDKKMSHEIALIYRDGKYSLINSWYKYHEQGLHNMYKITYEQIKEILKNKICFVPY